MTSKDTYSNGPHTSPSGARTAAAPPLYSSNGSGGSSTSPLSAIQKSKLAASSTAGSATNGHDNGVGVENEQAYAANGHDGSSQTNGHSETGGQLMRETRQEQERQRIRRDPMWFGHRREEVARLLIQGLRDLGYQDSAESLAEESGFELETRSVAAFRTAVLQGRWSEAENLLCGHGLSLGPASDPGGGGVGLPAIEDGSGSSGSLAETGLVLAKGVDREELKFKLRRQKYLELLEQKNLAGALMVLRQELTPLHQDMAQLHVLSSLIVCQSPEEVKAQASWDGAYGTSRRVLLSELSKSISPSVMIPEHRLATLLDQVRHAQICRCVYHNPIDSFSLFADHQCHRGQFPLKTLTELSSNQDEVYFLEFSHDGTRLAACGKDKAIVIYDLTTFEVQHTLREHSDSVAYVAWSPDDTKLITCSHDHKAKVWNTVSGTSILTIDHHKDPVTCAAWTSNGQSFVTGSLDRENQLCLWNLSGECVYTWPTDQRVQDCAISPDDQRLVMITSKQCIFIYNLVTREEMHHFDLGSQLTSVSISRDSAHVLVNLNECECQLIEMDTGERVRCFAGQKQGKYVIRSTFGGTDENLVISGSEDGKIYIWHKENGNLITTLEGHGKGCVNAVAWNPANPCMFASGGDDGKIRIWSHENAELPSNAISAFAHNGTSASSSRPPSSAPPQSSNGHSGGNAGGGGRTGGDPTAGMSPSRSSYLRFGTLL